MLLSSVGAFTVVVLAARESDGQRRGVAGWLWGQKSQSRGTILGKKSRGRGGRSGFGRLRERTVDIWPTEEGD